MRFPPASVWIESVICHFFVIDSYFKSLTAPCLINLSFAVTGLSRWSLFVIVTLARKLSWLFHNNTRHALVCQFVKEGAFDRTYQLRVVITVETSNWSSSTRTVWKQRVECDDPNSGFGFFFWFSKKKKSTSVLHTLGRILCISGLLTATPNDLIFSAGEFSSAFVFRNWASLRILSVCCGALLCPLNAIDDVCGCPRIWELNFWQSSPLLIVMSFAQYHEEIRKKSKKLTADSTLTSHQFGSFYYSGK